MAVSSCLTRKPLCKSCAYGCLHQLKLRTADDSNTRRLLGTPFFRWMLVVFLAYVLFAADVVAVTSAPNSVDRYIDGFLLVAMAIFAFEAAVSATCRQHPSMFTLFMDVVLVVFIAADLSWVRATWVDSAHGSHSVTMATIAASRAGKMTRLLYSLRVLHTLKVTLPATTMIAAD